MVPFAASAQRRSLYEKMSATTMMLMNDLQGMRDEGQGMRDEGQGTRDKGQRTRDKGQGTRDKVQRTRDKGQGMRDEGQGMRDKGEGTGDLGEGRQHRAYAAPDTIDGKAYVSSFLRVHDDARVAELQSLGVKIQSRFRNGLMTVLIPLDRIEDVASLNNVKRINVSSVAEPESDGALEAIHADDVLKLTNSALEAGLTKKYDGRGILLAVIDVGVDFQHIAFRDSVGNLRLKGAYVYDDNGEREVTDFDELTTDNSQNDHGTHVEGHH